MIPGWSAMRRFSGTSADRERAARQVVTVSRRLSLALPLTRLPNLLDGGTLVTSREQARYS